MSQWSSAKARHVLKALQKSWTKKLAKIAKKTGLKPEEL
jgi:DNA-binding Lrp family transcriptional regulator